MGVRIKAAALLFIFVAICFSLLVGTQAGKAYARANLTAYQTTAPNSWEPKGYNESGTAPYYITHTLGWDLFKLMGNVGLGDGSYQYLNATSNRDHNYTDNYFMASDISSAPIDPGRFTSISTAAAAAADVTTAQNNTTAPQENTMARGNMSRIEGLKPLGGSAKVRLAATDNATETGADNTTAGQDNVTATVPASAPEPAPAVNFGGVGGIGLNDPYHSIALGIPVNDMMYQYPLSPTISAYGRLVGLPLPGGNVANIGIRSLGYGY